MTNKQAAFVAEYLKDFNATQAATRAGYSPKGAYQRGHELLKNREIAQAVQGALERSAMTAEEALHRLAKIARGDMNNLITSDGRLDLEKARELGLTALIQEITTDTRVERSQGEPVADVEKVKVKLYNAQQALVDILKIHGKFIDRTENKHEIDVTGEIIVELVDA